MRRFFAVACVLAGSGIALGACSDANSGMGANAASGSSGAANPASASPAAGAGGTRAMVAAGGAGSSAANGGTNASATAGAGGAPHAGNAAVSGTGAGSGAGVSGGSSGTSALPMSGAGAGAAGGGGAGGSTAAASRCPPGPFGAPVPSGATPQRIDGVPPADAFNKQGSDRTNIEGAVWIGNTLYVSEFPFTPAPASRVLAIVPAASGTSATVSVSVAIADCGANGMAVDAQGNLVTTDHKLGAIVRYTFPLGTPATIVGTYDGKRFNSPNDLAIRSDGTIYFSDPDYQAPSMHPQMQTRFYRVAPGSSEARAIEQRSQPNGVTLSPDEKTLYVAGSDGILAYPVKDDGDIAPGSGVRVSGFNGGADGLAVDCAGNLYATSGQRVAVLSPSGMEIASIPVSGAESVTNVAFGGPERKTLFITSMGTNTQRGVFRVELNVPGMPY